MTDAKLTEDSLIVHYARELLAEYHGKTGDMLDLESLEGRLADTLSRIVHLIEDA